MSFLSYLTSELSRGYKLERDEAKYSEKRERVYSFMKTPRALEKFLFYGFVQCADAFLFTFTFLPLRIVIACVRLIMHPCLVFKPGISRRAIEQAQICDILKGVVILLSSFLLSYIDISMLYHIIRGQSVIKLYIFFNMLELADKLFSTFGQDILDSLFWTAMEPRGRRREHVGVLPHLLLAVLYVSIHCVLFLLQMTTLNVAFNSHNKSLLTIMMSNNFVEIKSNVFRRMDKNNLFQMTCSDAKERFYYVILLVLVLTRNMIEISWNADHFWSVIPDALLLVVAEVLVDWFKHAFVTKFNEINSDVYHEFTVSLAKDITANRKKYAFIDNSDLVSRRMTFTPLPLACLVIQMSSKMFRFSGILSGVAVITAYACLTTLKIITSICLLGKASYLIRCRTHSESDSSCKPHISATVNESEGDACSARNNNSVVRERCTQSQPRSARQFSMGDQSMDNLSEMALLSNSSVSLNSLMLQDDRVEAIAEKQLLGEGCSPIRLETQPDVKDSSLNVPTVTSQTIDSHQSIEVEHRKTLSENIECAQSESAKRAKPKTEINDSLLIVTNITTDDDVTHSLKPDNQYHTTV